MARDWDAAHYQQRHHYVWTFGKGVIEWLDPQPGERILDLGCGTGQLTAEIVATGASVVGIDAAPSMIEKAKAQFPAIDFRLADARTFSLNELFDAVFSNAALHWVQPADAAIARISAALKPGGRFVAEFGGKGNIQAVLNAIHASDPSFENPWYFPAVGEYASILEAHSLEVQRANLFDRLTPLEGEDGMRDWLRMFLPALDESIAANAVSRLAATNRNDAGWFADYRRIRVFAVKRSQE